MLYFGINEAVRSKAKEVLLHADLTGCDNVGSYKEEVLTHLKKITQGKDVVVLFSGGMDSRFLCLALQELGVEFTTLTYCFSEDFSDYSAVLSTDFCCKHNITHEKFFISPVDIQECFNRLIKKGVYYGAANDYYIQVAVDRLNFQGHKGVVLSGFGCEYSIKNNSVHIPWRLELLLEHNKNTLQIFRNARTLVSWLKTDVVRKSYDSMHDWNYRTADTYWLRDNVYGQSYTDLKVAIPKNFSDESKILKYIDKQLVPIINTKAPYFNTINPFSTFNVAHVYESF